MVDDLDDIEPTFEMFRAELTRLRRASYAAGYAAAVAKLRNTIGPALDEVLLVVSKEKARELGGQAFDSDPDQQAKPAFQPSSATPQRAPRGRNKSLVLDMLSAWPGDKVRIATMKNALEDTGELVGYSSLQQVFFQLENEGVIKKHPLGGYTLLKRPLRERSALDIFDIDVPEKTDDN